MAAEGKEFQASSIASEAASSIVQLQSFTMFTKLPMEVRKMIWQYTLPGPRMLEVAYNWQKTRLKSLYPPPVALYICPESRAEARKRYALALDNQLNPCGNYFDFSQDGLVFGPYTYGEFPGEETVKSIGDDLARVQTFNFLTHQRTMPTRRNIFGWLSPAFLGDLTPFKSLQEIVILVDPVGRSILDKAVVEISSITLVQSLACTEQTMKLIEEDRNTLNKSLANLKLERTFSSKGQDHDSQRWGV
jgi:hypothetical protein